MSFLSVVPLHYPHLDSEPSEEITKYFRTMLSQDEDALLFYIDIADYISAWKLPNHRKVKAMMKEHILKELITSYIRCDDSMLVGVFESVRLNDSLIQVWLNPKAMPYLINAHLTREGFASSVPIELLQPFRSVYTAKIFERLVRFADTGVLYLTPESICDITRCKSASYGVIKRDVLLKAEKELLKCKLLVKNFVIDETRVGNKVKNIKLSFKLSSKVRPSKLDALEESANEDVNLNAA